MPKNWQWFYYRPFHAFSANVRIGCPEFFDRIFSNIVSNYDKCNRLKQNLLAVEGSLSKKLVDSRLPNFKVCQRGVELTVSLIPLALLHILLQGRIMCSSNSRVPGHTTVDSCPGRCHKTFHVFQTKLSVWHFMLDAFLWAKRNQWCMTLPDVRLHNDHLKGQWRIVLVYFQFKQKPVAVYVWKFCVTPSSKSFCGWRNFVLATCAFLIARNHNIATTRFQIVHSFAGTCWRWNQTKQRETTARLAVFSKAKASIMLRFVVKCEAILRFEEDIDLFFKPRALL